MWGVRYIQGKLHERAAKYENETPTDKAARRTADATVLIAIFTVVLAGVSGITLYEVIEGGNDTHALAMAANDQATALRGQVQQMETQGQAIRAQALASADLVNKWRFWVMLPSLLQSKPGDPPRLPRILWLFLKRIPGGSARASMGRLSFLSLSVKILRWEKPSPRSCPCRIVAGSPAIHVRIDFRMNTICGTFPKRPEYGPIPDHSRSILMPGAPPVRTSETRGVRPIGDSDKDILAKKSDCNLYAFAMINYDDTFGKSHWRHVCTVWQKGTPRAMLDCGFYADGDEDYPDGKEPELGHHRHYLDIDLKHPSIPQMPARSPAEPPA